MAGPVIALDAVSKRFGKKEVLRSVTLEVHPGQTFAFLGLNAAGKTTTIRMLLGLLQPDSGTVRVMGRDPAREAIEVRRQVGYLAEDQTMFGWMTVEQILAFMAPFYPTWDRELAKTFLRQFELPPSGKVKHLSKGQNVRLGLLLALAHRPEVVILDDPALGLDPIMRREFNRDLITHLQGEGRTVFYSSHLLHEVEAVADVIAILDHGRIVKQAPTERLRQQVKRIVFNAAAYDQVADVLDILDLRRSGGEVAVTVENAPKALPMLQSLGIEHRALELNLDDIFEAYVTGRSQDTGPRPADARVVEQV